MQRSSHLIDEKDFLQLLSVIGNRRWLAKRSSQLYALWAECENDSEKSLIQRLLENFIVIDSEQVESFGESLAAHTCQQWKLSSKNTRVFATCFGAEADGSQAALQVIKNKFPDEEKWKAENFRNNIQEVQNISSGIENLVIFDDFIGTGDTIERRLVYVREILASKNLAASLYVISLAAMEQAKSKLSALGVEYFSPLWVPKGISDQFPPSEQATALQTMRAFENRVSKGRISNFSLGYKASEALYWMQGHNVPNNVFPAFWWAREKRRPLFRHLGNK